MILSGRNYFIAFDKLLFFFSVLSICSCTSWSYKWSCSELNWLCVNERLHFFLCRSWRQSHLSLLKAVGGRASRSFSETRQLPFLPDLLRQPHTYTLLKKIIIISSFQLETVSQSDHSISLAAPFIPGSIPRSLLRARWHWRLAQWVVTRTTEIINHTV